jgi:DNA/RNA-binding domain of Phe-tRNA-synthetase-like protein
VRSAVQVALRTNYALSAVEAQVRSIIIDSFIGLSPTHNDENETREIYMLDISATNEWRAAHPGAIIGLLELSGVDNSHASAELNQRKRETEAGLRERYQGFARADFVSLPVMSAYNKYYKRFSKTYHVLLQLESIVSKGKSLPDVSPLVDSNFVAEVDTLVLTAGHDAAKLQGPVVMDVAREGDQIEQMTGALKPVLVGDMIMRDAHGVCCSIIYGQDNLSPISPATTHVLYVSYAPSGVPAEAVDMHLNRMEENVRLFAPNAVLERHELIRA